MSCLFLSRTFHEREGIHEVNIKLNGSLPLYRWCIPVHLKHICSKQAMSSGLASARVKKSIESGLTLFPPDVSICELKSSGTNQNKIAARQQQE